MFKTIYPIKQSCIYSQFPEKSCGQDQVSDLLKNAAGEAEFSELGQDVYYPATYNSRILIQFDLTDISSSIVQGKITGNASYYLTLKATEAQNLAIDYTIYAYPISGSWTGGKGFVNSNPASTNGVSWKYRDSKLQGTLWATSSLGSGVTASYSTIPHGGTWYTSSAASQSFSHENPDIRMDVTRIVRSWLSGSIANNGMILKYADSDEFSLEQFGLISFFSTFSHTIFLPRLECYWDDSNLSGTGSFTEVSSDDFVLSVKNMKDSYADTEIPKIRLFVRDQYPQQTYATSSNYLAGKRLPAGSYFQIQDLVTDDIIIPFHPSGTKINCDSEGNWFKMDCQSLMSERYYKFVFKSEFSGGDEVVISDQNYIFKIRRN